VPCSGSPSRTSARPEDWEAWGAELAERLTTASGGLAAAALAALFVWTLAFVVFCFFQAGTYGILYAGDRQAPAGVPAHAQWFRTFSRRDFSGFGGRHLWRFFWFFNLRHAGAPGSLALHPPWQRLLGERSVGAPAR
jgi:hypothetical protein